MAPGRAASAPGGTGGRRGLVCSVFIPHGGATALDWGALRAGALLKKAVKEKCASQEGLVVCQIGVGKGGGLFFDDQMAQFSVINLLS